MDLLLIFILIIILPLILMPRDIAAGVKSPYRVVFNSALYIGVAALAVFVSSSLMGQGVFSQIQDTVDEMARMMANDSNVSEMLQLSDTTEAERIEMFANLYNSIFQSLPAYILAFGAIVSYVEYMALAKMFGRRSQQVKKLPPFREFSLPPHAVTGIVGMYAAAWLITTAEIMPNDMLYVNMNFIFDFAFSLQGVSVVLMYFHMKRAPKAIGVLAALIMWSIFIGRMMLMLLGMFDLILKLKTRIQNNSSGR